MSGNRVPDAPAPTDGQVRGSEPCINEPSSTPANRSVTQNAAEVISQSTSQLSHEPNVGASLANNRRGPPSLTDSERLSAIRASNRERARRYRERQRQAGINSRNLSNPQPGQMAPRLQPSNVQSVNASESSRENNSNDQRAVTDSERLRQIRIMAAERQRRYREHRSGQSSNNHDIVGPPRQPQVIQINSDETMREPSMSDHWRAASIRFRTRFSMNPFGHSCGICDRLWFKSDLKPVNERGLVILRQEFDDIDAGISACSNCLSVLRQGKLPPLSKTNGFTYPPKPSGLPELNPISTRLISPRIPFMSIRRLTRDGQYGIIGQVINIPIDVDSMIRQIPRPLEEDYAFNVALKRKLIHKSSYLSGFVTKRTLRAWLEYLVQQPLYRHYNISIDWSRLEGYHDDVIQDSGLVEDIEADALDAETLAARQQTLLWNEENCLEIAPGQASHPLNIIFDAFAEELSFPNIYYGVGRSFNPRISVTPYMIANSEIRRTDRRGTTPEHILYMAMKILRLRVVDGIYNSFRCVQQTENISRRMLEDRGFLRECVEKNLSFLKSIPNSSYYWLCRKKDLFAMIRQLGKPSAFLTMSANETNWPDLVKLLHNLNDYRKDINVVNPLEDLDRSMRSHLVTEDPVTCCIYFYKMISIILNMLRSNQGYNPFGKYRVLDFFIRIEFQHRGSPHAHTLLWFENDPREPISENMPLTEQLVTNLCSVSSSDLADPMYKNQVHKHTFTCTKRGETSCRFNIPYWPMKKTRILLPIPRDDERLPSLRTVGKRVRERLSTKIYDSIETFLVDNRLDEESYLNVIRAFIKRPTLIFKRNMSEIMTNTFNPWIASTLNSNMDLQYILDTYSCATYVVDYVNKTDRGTGNLHRELLKLNEAHPEMTYDKLLKRLGSKILNTVEMSAQEAAWYLLRQPMSECSREVIYIPTCSPCERQKSHKSKYQLDRENISADSTDIWTKSIIEKYEERPPEMENICLADFAAWQTAIRRSNAGENMDRESNDGFEASEGIITHYRSREFKRIIRFRNYDMSDVNNFKRELVTLFLPFRNEQADVLDRDRYKNLYEVEFDLITAKMKEYDSGCDIEQAIEDYRALFGAADEPEIPIAEAVREAFVRDVLGENGRENFDDFERDAPVSSAISIVRKRNNLMDKESYCSLMRTTNERQRELILEIIHRLRLPGQPPIQVFFTGPAGCGKTYVLKLIMETVNRFSLDQNSLNNSYVACASTGKAAVNLGGTTVHSAFHITQSKRVGSIARETLQQYRHVFANVRHIIIDEVSMIGSDLLHKINQRLQEITGDLDSRFGNINIIFCGDFKQLPPVLATPVYKGNRRHLEGALLWQSLDYYPLSQVMRQSDRVFSTILTKVGEGSPLTSDESRLMESRFRQVQWCDEHLKGVVRLFHQNHLVDAYNRKVIQNGISKIAKDTISGNSSNDQLTAARRKLHKLTTMEASGLPYEICLSIGIPYMLTCNIDVEDGLVNGSLGILRYVETSPFDDDNVTRVWLELTPSHVGAKARMKAMPFMVSHRGAIRTNWTPIIDRSVGIALGGNIKCKRTQLPLSAACALTIHKSQGGTFDRVVVDYDKSQPNQLVYVALSRVTSIDGLFLTNSKNDFRFHHSKGSTAPCVKEVRDEYLRLARHPLPTLADEVRAFMRSNIADDGSVLICTMNTQSLVAHSKDLETDTILTQADVLVLTETWMNENSLVSVNNFSLVCFHYGPRAANMDENLRRVAGGVAIYKNLASTIECYPISASTQQITDTNVGDIALCELRFDSNHKLILVGIYIHPGVSRVNIQLFILYALARFVTSTRRVSPQLTSDIEVPILLTGDFNINITNENWLLNFLDTELNLSYVPSLHPTTIGNTTIDLTFVRNLEVNCMSYVSYFSYHRPLINKVLFH